MAKKTFANPAEYLLSKEPQPETGGSETAQSTERKTERISVVVSADMAQDLNDLLFARLVRNKKVEGAIMGKRSKKPSVNLLVIEALTEFLQKPETQTELSEYRARFQ